MKRILLSLLILQFFLPVFFIAGCVPAGKTSTLGKDALPQNNLSAVAILKLNRKIGSQYWIKESKSVTFYFAPSIHSESFTADDKTSFILKELIVNGSGNNVGNFYKVRFTDSGKTAYLLVRILDEDYPFNKTGLSTENPKTDEERLKENLRLKEDVRKLTGISEGKSLWLREPWPWFERKEKSRKEFLFIFLEEIKLKDFDVEKIEKYEGKIFVKLYLESKGEEDQVNLSVEGVRDRFYTKNPYPDLKKKWGKRFWEILKAIRANRLLFGMTKEQAKLSVGTPYDINRSVGSWGIHEQWVYRNRGLYLYFEDGKLTSWQE